MQPSLFLHAAVFVIAVGPRPVHSKGFLVQQKNSLRSSVDLRTFNGEIRNAMGEALGCGGHTSPAQMAAIEASLMPIWQALPKNGKGRVERRSLRYLAHRYFNRAASLLVRGLEPGRVSNETGWGSADILSQQVPAFVESALESKHKRENGFDLKDAVYMVATLEELIFDSESTLLERAYRQANKPLGHGLSETEIHKVLETYMVYWLMGDDENAIRMVLANNTLLESVIPHWGEIVGLAHGQAKALDFRRQRAQAVDRLRGNALSKQYSFEETHEVVGSITRSFASFWESECATMKALLVDMDVHHTGRIPLSKFYSSALETDWRFGESESYLRELGALDETSSWVGKQVIIPNYMQAASNCIVSTSHYLVCCLNECEALLGEIEAAVRSPLAPPSVILSIVTNMTGQTSIDHDDTPQLVGSLTAQLEQIAATHDGKVPLHGRLFAQWLHYAFPRECPFPHKIKSEVALTPAQFGDGYIATRDEMQKHALSVNESEVLKGMGKDELDWMSQWSEDEELIARHVISLHAPWESSHVAVGGALLILVCGLLGTVGFSRKTLSSDQDILPTYTKSHFV